MYFNDFAQAIQQIPSIPVEKIVSRNENPSLSEMSSHSSQTGKGSVFCCCAGDTWDGHNFAQEALLKGARALLCERELPLEAPQIIIPCLRENLGQIAALFYNYPGEKLRLTGITGTNGKTSTTYIMRSIVEAAGKKCGLIGSLGYFDGEEQKDLNRTTPEAPELQSIFASMVRNKCTDAVMEVSSHAVGEGRVEACFFDGLIFSNLTQDHLDYHGNMENYFQAKKKLFTHHIKETWYGAVNGEDSYGARLYRELYPSCVTYGLKETASPVSLLSAEIHGDRSEITILGPDNKEARLTIPLGGKFNLYNALGAITLGVLYKIEWEAIIRGVQEVPRIPGRMETYATEKGFSCIIDFAHTPDALAKLLETLRECCKGKLRVLFGSGGNRCEGKRIPMGIAVGTYADDIIITMDNPRFEDPLAIAQENYKGVLQVQPQACCRIITNREEAIKALLDSGEEGDILVLAGKGVEPYIEIEGVKRPFLDKKIFEEWSSEKGVAFQ